MCSRRSKFHNNIFLGRGKPKGLNPNQAQGLTVKPRCTQSPAHHIYQVIQGFDAHGSQPNFFFGQQRETNFLITPPPVAGYNKMLLYSKMKLIKVINLIIANKLTNYGVFLGGEV